MRDRVDKAARELGLKVVALGDKPSVKTHAVGVPRIALVHDWINTQNEGWWRIAFDQYEVPFEYVSVHTIRDTADLRARFDVILYPPIGGASVQRQITGLQTGDAIPWKASEKYPNFGGPDQTDDMRGGFGFEGLANLRRFVEGGGLLVAAGSSVSLPVGTGHGGGGGDRRSARAAGARQRAAREPGRQGQPDRLRLRRQPRRLLQPGAGARGRDRRWRSAARAGTSSSTGRPRRAASPAAAGRRIPTSRRAARTWRRRKRRRRAPQSLADLPDEVLDFARNLLPPDDRLPRVVARFAKKDDLWISGMLDKGEELAEKPMIVDCPVGKGHVVLFANNPIWRAQTYGSHSLVFNALLNWDNLGVGRAAAKPKESAEAAR